jgi:glycine dehydrogenase subunit 1
MQFVPHTDDEIAAMLDFIGVDSLDHLFDMVPAALRYSGQLDIANGLSEFDTMSELQRMASANRSDLICFAGGGAYDHDVPSVVRRLAGRTEFVTSYTPYQPEVAQGVLQVIFEYQTMVSRIFGLPVANASLYDGATACVEAANMAVGVSGNSTVMRSAGLNPRWAETMQTAAVGTGHNYVDVPLTDGRTDWSAAEVDGVGALIVQQPNYYGVMEDLGEARRVADHLGSLLIVAFDPVAAGLLKTPGAQGADIAVGEGQPFGTPMSLGGPYLGLFACRSEYVRKMPGRLVGETVDSHGRRAYVTTLRTREQDIRREKATSNVCTNQTLIAVTAAIHLAWLGTDGLRELALRCARGTRYLREQIMQINGVEPCFKAPTFREFAVRLSRDVSDTIDRLVDRGFLAGISLAPAYQDALLLSVTERRTKAEIDALVAAFEEVMA